MTSSNRSSMRAVLLYLATAIAWSAGGRSLAADEAAVYVDESGRVGVGTTRPASPLSVAGSAAIGTEGFVSSPISPANGLAVEGKVGIGTSSPRAALDVKGDAVIAGELTVDGSLFVSKQTSVAVRRQQDDKEQTTYQRPRPQGYHLSITTPIYNGRTKEIPMSVVTELCGTSDGCEVHLWATGWELGENVAGPEMVTRLFFQRDPSGDRGRWRTTDVLGAVKVVPWGKGTPGAHVLEYGQKCYFTSISYTAFNPKGDPGTGLLLLLWDGGKADNRKNDTPTPRTCELLLLP